MERLMGQEDNGMRVNLAESHPIAFRYVFERSAMWFLALLGLLVLFVGVNLAVADGNSSLVYFCNKGILLAATVVCAVIVVKTIYSILYRATYFYGIEGRHFVISKGVILKQRRSCPFNHITDFYIGRSFTDFLFQLNYLEVRTPAQDSEEIGKIEGLSFSSAVALQDYLTDLLEHGLSREPNADGNGDNMVNSMEWSSGGTLFSPESSNKSRSPRAADSEGRPSSSRSRRLDSTRPHRRIQSSSAAFHHS
ncbi:MAG: PH domain-containing protein [Bdellovibrionota bacterium]